MKFDINWFNASPRFVRLFGVLFKSYNLFNRKYVATQGEPLRHDWGIGLIQFGAGHLFFIGRIENRIRLDLLFLGPLFAKAYLPFDRIHHFLHGFGWLIIPTPKGWIAFFDRKELRSYNAKIVLLKYSFRQRFRLVKRDHFHNCRATGRY